MKDVNNGKKTVIYNAKEVISGLKTPIVKDPQVLDKNLNLLLTRSYSEGEFEIKYLILR